MNRINFFEDRQTDQPTNQPTNRPVGLAIEAPGRSLKITGWGYSTELIHLDWIITFVVSGTHIYYHAVQTQSCTACTHATDLQQK